MKNVKYGFIYLTTNLINNKKYIGQHTKYNNDYFGSSYLLIQDIKKYGKENFKREILEYADSKEELDSLEKFYIRKYNAVQSDEYYNIHLGGSGGNTMAGWTEERRKEFKEKMSKITSGKNNPNYGKKLPSYRRELIRKKRLEYYKNISDEDLLKFKETMRKVTKGEKNGMYGKKHKKSSLEKMSINSKNLTKGEKNGMYGKKGKKAINGQKVIALDENKNIIHEFNTLGEALKFLGIKGHTSLINACKNNTMYRNYYWEKTYSKCSKK